MRAAGNGRADDAKRLLLQSGQNFRAVRSVGNEADPEAPDEFLLGRTINLDGQHARMNVRKLAKERFLKRILEEETEIGVVAYRYDVDPFLSRPDDRVHNRVAFLETRRIACRIVREIQQHNGFAFILLSQERIQQPVAVEGHIFGEQRIIHELRTPADTEGQLIVLPVLVGIDDGVAWSGEQVGDDA
ncbi:hypothetical protein D3C73_1280710 [compost metagenome]